MLKAAAFSLLLICTPAAFAADGTPQPQLQPDDTWTYRSTLEQRPTVWRQTHIEGVVLRNSGTTILLRNTEVGSTNPPTELLTNADWSRFRSIDGQETVVSRPFVFPLVVGKTWDLAYTDSHPSNTAHKSEERKLHYRVVGWEEVEVPAGKFRALKVEAEGSWIAEVNPRAAGSAATQGGSAAAQVVTTPAHTATGRIYEGYWYAPETKRFVKTVTEFYDAAGIRNERTTVELESYKVAG